ncbi:uncharacterized protein [Dermacentor andersoni]|uniref:uncharacterized protein n=1 Tax=Dermacentor andersoni TaxID=34620 RepID=UPI0024179F68|nr:uncharacterized protein LOC129387801 [Dermacentor andersoni]
MTLGITFRATVLRVLTATPDKVNQVNNAVHGKGVQAERIDDSNLILLVNDMTLAAQAFANEAEIGHGAQGINTDLPNMRIRMTLQERVVLCQGGSYRKATLVVVTATGLPEELSRKIAKNVITML